MHAADPAVNDAALVARLATRVDETVRALLAGARKVALLDFPNHANVGDSAIWLGELRCLRRAGVRVTYSCDHVTFNHDDMIRAIGDGPILLHGGGNLGDLWPEYQEFREAVIRSCPRNPIIQLPQSIHFRDQRARDRAAAVINAHPRLTLMVREEQSLANAAAFRVPVHLCPDAAFCLGSLARPPAAATEVLWLARTDLEAVPDAAPAGGAVRVDWLEETGTPLWWFERRLARWGARHPGITGRPARWVAGRTFGSLARQRLARGVGLLGQAKVVVTDRLHGHILCLLLGIPNVLLDNVYGKLRAFHETWTSESVLTRRAARVREAMTLAAQAGRP